VNERAETIARVFHETYEQLAPGLGYKTRDESAVPWAEVPAKNKALMIATVDDLLGKGVIEQGVADGGGEWERVVVPLNEMDTPSLATAQRFYDEGMVWLANRVLHPFGWAIGVMTDERFRVRGLLVMRTTDPDGVVMPNVDEIDARRRFFRAVFQRGQGKPPETAVTGEENVCPECQGEMWFKNGERGCGNPRCSAYKPFPRETEEK